MRKTYRTTIAVLFLLSLVNFLFAGTKFNGSIQNCCSKIIEEKSCCMMEPEITVNLSCHQETKPITESFSSCGCIHDNPISDNAVLIKNNVELPKTFASTIDYENDDLQSNYSSYTKFESFNLSYNSSPIYIINSSFLI